MFMKNLPESESKASFYSMDKGREMQNAEKVQSQSHHHGLGELGHIVHLNACTLSSFRPSSSLLPLTFSSVSFNTSFVSPSFLPSFLPPQTFLPSDKLSTRLFVHMSSPLLLCRVQQSVAQLAFETEMSRVFCEANSQKCSLSSPNSHGISISPAMRALAPQPQQQRAKQTISAFVL